MAGKSKHKGPTPYLQRGMSDVISYEDILVAQYMDQIEKSPPKSKKDRDVPVSPYAIATQTGQQTKSRRPKSAISAHRKKRDMMATDGASETWAHRVPNIAWEETAEGGTVEHLGTRTPPSSKPKRRPMSAPAARPRSGSITSGVSSTYSRASRSSYSRGTGSVSGSSMKRNKPLYKKKPHVICVRAFQNGNRDNYARVTAQDLQQLLDNCTSKLGLVSAARKLYFDDGEPVMDARQIEKDADIYVSCGEAFKDPYEAYKKREELRRSASWTLSGIILPEDKSRGKTKPTLTKRMRTLVESQKRRILVFRNGDSSEGVEIVAGRFDEFLDDCTAKLNLESGARRLYDWEGKEVKSFSEVPVLDAILQPSTTVVLGPVWVTKGGERFSPKGSYNFGLTLLMNTKERLKYSKAYKEQLETQMGDHTMTSSKEMMSMNKNEILTEVKEVDEHITELSIVMPLLKKQLKQLSETVKGETEVEGYKSQQIDANSRLLGKQGLRLKVYENGRNDGEVIIHFNLREAEKGIQGEPSKLMHRFLDACTGSQRVGDGGAGPAGRSIAKRVFLKDGAEIKNVHELEYDQEIWLSYGEEFKQLTVICLQLNLDKVSCMSLWDEKEIVQREPLMEDEKGRDKPTAWKAVKSFPPGSKRQLVTLDMPGPQRLSYAEGLQGSRVDENGYFLQSRERKNVVVYPEVSVEVKMKKGTGGIWPSDAQLWAITQGGLIFSKAMPQLALTRSDKCIQVEYGDDTLTGCTAYLAKRTPREPNQQWGFSPTGQIYSIAKPSLVLTHVGERHVTMVNPDDQAAKPSNEAAPSRESEEIQGASLASLHFTDLNGEANGNEPSASSQKPDEETPGPSLADLKDVFGGQRYTIAMFPKLPGKHPCSNTQRWALKQEDLSTIGQWKNTTVSNPEWNKRALSWPVTEDGTWNTEFTWPMEGFLLPFAPPVRRASEKKANTHGSATRLRVLRNGESDESRSVIVVGPDLTNMWRDVNDASPKKKNKRRSTSHSSTDVSGVYDTDSCHPLDLKRLELELFMDQCTEALSLPFAARRLFDEEGRDVMCISDLSRDQLVYASCGEGWTDPKMSYSDQQRRALLMSLASDVARIRQYAALRNPQDLVLGVEGTVAPGARLIVNTCMLSTADREKLTNKPSDEEDDNSPNGFENGESPASALSHVLTAHERAHARSEERLKSMRWSWENDRTSKGEQEVEGNDDADFNDEVVFSDPHLQKRFRRHSIKTQDVKTESADPSFRQKWHYSDGFIHLKKHSQLVLGLDESFSESKSTNEVLLCKKKVEDPSQRWTISEDGTISLRSKSNLVLSVTTPPLGNDPFTRDEALDFGFRGSAVIAAHRKPYGNGSAHQLWTFDRLTGFVDAFATDTTNKEITAANKANVCTYGVLGPRDVFQPGYVYMLGTSREKLLCEACGKASRGKNKLQRLGDTKRFSCAMGTESENGSSKLSGSFKCLNSKVDLSTLEADSTLELWEYQLERLRNEGSVRTITRELHVAKSVPAVRIMAYKNGDGSRGLGVLVIGTSIHSLLDQATARLGLTQAARRLYTVRGELITDVDQLVRPYDVSMMTSHPASVDDLAEEVQKKAKIREGTPPIRNGHAVDYVEAENRQVEVDDDQSSGNETYRVEEGRKGSAPSVNDNPAGFPRWDTRWPIDVWVSCGEPFVPLADADKQYLLSMKHREERTWVQAYIDIEKHVLRHMQGRRITGFNPPKSPQAAAQAWDEPTRKEESKEETINELKKHLLDVKSRQKKDEVVLSKSAKETTQRLYSKPKTVRVSVYPNSETTERAVTVFGATVQEILDNSTSRLDLNSAARRLFKQDGEEIQSIDGIRRDEMLCVSCGEGFMQARDRRHQMELKATWSRMTRHTGGAVLPGSRPVSASVTFESAQLALPAPPSPPLRGSPSPGSRQSSVHTLRGGGKPFHQR